MYIETSDPRKKGEKARLVTPVESVQNFNNKKCLFFYYHSFGIDVGALNVYSVKDIDFIQNKTQSSLNPLWSVSTNLGDQWFLASVNTEFKNDFRIIFEGVVGKSYLGDVVSIYI